MMTRKITALAALALSLAACGGGDDSVDSNGGEDTGPQGDVRGGTISDAMLPVAMVQSQAPQLSDDGGAGDEEAGANDAE